MMKTPYSSLATIIGIYNRRKALETQRLVLDAPNDRVVIMEKFFDPDTNEMSEHEVGTVTRADIIAAKDDIAAARVLINAFVIEVQALT